MSQTVISDNWSLQNISEMFRTGLSTDNANYIDINLNKSSFSYREISEAAIITEAFFDFITDIILRDQIIVDSDFVHTWKCFYSPINKVSEAGIISEIPFKVDNNKLEEPRNEFVQRLCTTNDLMIAHEENRIGWLENHDPSNRLLSQILWGGAGMLARSFVYEKGYTPHPIRKRFFNKTGLTLPTANAVSHIANIINEKRAKISSIQNSNSELYSLTINMPPLPIRVIQESNSVDDLITVALQLRDEFKSLRDWLDHYQKAMSDGSYKDISKFQEIIQSVSLYVDSLMGSHDSNAPTFSAGISIFKVAIKGHPLNTLQNQFGVRAMINNLILSRSGKPELKKFLKFFGHEKSRVGLQVLEHFS